MPQTTVLFGVVLLGLGIVSYFTTGMASPTALIPAAFGLILLILGIAAQNESRRKHAMHAAAAVGLVGFAGSASGLFKLPRLLAGEAVARPSAVYAQSIMAILSVLFVALCVKSFRDARRRRTAS